MKDYIEHSNYPTEEKEELKNNYEHWADVTLDGIKQRLRDSDKFALASGKANHKTQNS